MVSRFWHCILFIFLNFTGCVTIKKSSTPFEKTRTLQYGMSRGPSTRTTPRAITWQTYYDPNGIKTRKVMIKKKIQCKESEIVRKKIIMYYPTKEMKVRKKFTRKKIVTEIFDEKGELMWKEEEESSRGKINSY